MRDERWDVLKGILITTVVVGHASVNNMIHDIIYLFHLPLFFVVSGYFFHSQRLMLSFVKQKFSRLIIPSFVYSLIHAMLSSNCKIKFWLKLLYGGRAIGGVYWYSTCLFYSYILMAFIVSKYTGKMRLSIIGILCGGAAVIASYFVARITVLQYPGVPWNLDVVPMTFMYMIIGYVGKDWLSVFIHTDSRKRDFIAACVVLFL